MYKDSGYRDEPHPFSTLSSVSVTIEDKLGELDLKRTGAARVTASFTCRFALIDSRSATTGDDDDGKTAFGGGEMPALQVLTGSTVTAAAPVFNPTVSTVLLSLTGSALQFRELWLRFLLV